jgi:RimK family alpha-L-glutamate ligase
MRVAILSARTGWHTDELCRALVERGHTAAVVPYERLLARTGRSAADPERSPSLTSNGVSLLDADAVLARIIPAGSLEQIIFRVDALHWLERHGVTVMNPPRAIERSVDKFYTDALLSEAGIRTPPTIVCETIDAAMDAVRELGEVVIKPIFGSMGHGLVRVGDPDTAWRVLRALDQVRTVFYVQQIIPHGGRDIRAFVVGGRVIGAIERTARGDDWRSNVSRGASARAMSLTADWTDLAVRAASVIGADYAGVDLLPAGDGSAYVLEINGIPGWEGVQAACGVDVAGFIVDHLTTRAPVRAPAAAAAT